MLAASSAAGPCARLAESAGDRRSWPLVACHDGRVHVRTARGTTDTRRICVGELPQETDRTVLPPFVRRQGRDAGRVGAVQAVAWPLPGYRTCVRSALQPLESLRIRVGVKVGHPPSVTGPQPLCKSPETDALPLRSPSSAH